MPKCSLCDRDKPETDLIPATGTFRVCKECCPNEKPADLLSGGASPSYDEGHGIAEFSPREPDDPIGCQFTIKGERCVIAAQSKENPKDYLAIELSDEVIREHGICITIQHKMGFKNGGFTKLD